MSDGAEGGTCPGAACEPGAILLGVVGADGRVAHMAPELRIDAAFVDARRARALTGAADGPADA